MPSIEFVEAIYRRPEEQKNAQIEAQIKKFADFAKTKYSNSKELASARAKLKQGQSLDDGMAWLNGHIDQMTARYKEQQRELEGLTKYKLLMDCLAVVDLLQKMIAICMHDIATKSVHLKPHFNSLEDFQHAYVDGDGHVTDANVPVI